MGFTVPLENFSRIWRRHHFRWRASNFDQSSAPMAIEQWWFFIVVISEVPWHSHPLPSFSSGAVTACVYDLGLLRLGFEHPTFPLRDQRSNPNAFQRNTDKISITFYLVFSFPLETLIDNLLFTSYSGYSIDIEPSPIMGAKVKLLLVTYGNLLAAIESS